MGTLNERAAVAKLHQALHRNVYVLGLHYPMTNDLIAHFKETMFEKPNSAAFHHLSHYLTSIIEPKNTKSLSWAMFEVKMEAKYRNEFLKLVGNFSKEHPGHISPIMASRLVNAGGIKVIKLMYELSQLAMKSHILRKSPKNVNLNVTELNLVEISAAAQVTKKSLEDKVTKWHTKSEKLKKIADIYKKNLPIVEDQQDKKTLLLEKVVCNIIAATEHFRPLELKKMLTDVFIDDCLITEWHLHIETKILKLEKSWQENSSSILGVARKCRNRSEQVVQMQANQFKDSILEYDQSKDVLELSSEFENDLSVTQRAILKSNVQNGVLNFPNLLKSFAVVISHSFKSYIPSESTADLLNTLEEKESFLMFIKQQSVDLAVETFKFHNQMKDYLEDKEYQSSSIYSPTTIFEVLNFPSNNLQAIYEEDVSDYWCKCLEKFNFSEFKHPFKNDKVPYIHELEDSKCSNNNLSHSFISKEKSSCLDQTINKINNKPDYLKNIEELKRNMEIISDVGHKSILGHHNLTSTIHTERKQPSFSSNHLRCILTSIKKQSNSKNAKLKYNRSLRKTWGNLFDESLDNVSVLHKTQSPANLLSEDFVGSTKKSRITRPVSERISGIKEIDYSSFLSDLGSTPNLSSSSEKENTPLNNLHINNNNSDLKKNTANTPTFSDEDFKKPEITPCQRKMTTPPRRKSLESLINTFKKFKQSRGLGVSAENKAESDIKLTGDSFLETVHLENKSNEENVAIVEKDNTLFLSSVPDLLNPSLDFPIRKNTNPK